MSKSKVSSSSSRSSLKDKEKNRDAEEEEESVVEDAVQLAWKVVGKTATAELARMDQPHQIASKLAVILGLGQCEENLSEAALLDDHVATYWFARECKFTDEQTSTLFTIVHTLITNLRDRQLSLLDNIQQLQGMLAGVGVSSETAVQCLSPEAARQVVEFVTTSLFQHYRLFQYRFEEQQSELHIELPLSVEVPPLPTTFCPPPLDEAMSLELYERCLAPQPPVQEETLPQTEETDAQQTTSVMPDHLTQEENEVLMKVPPEELKAVMDTLTSDTITSYQTEVFTKLEEMETTFINRLSKLEKSLTST